jgi:hypothetical protein
VFEEIELQVFVLIGRLLHEASVLFHVDLLAGIRRRRCVPKKKLEHVESNLVLVREQTDDVLHVGPIELVVREFIAQRLQELHALFIVGQTSENRAKHNINLRKGEREKTYASLGALISPRTIFTVRSLSLALLFLIDVPINQIDCMLNYFICMHIL